MGGLRMPGPTRGTGASATPVFGGRTVTKALAQNVFQKCDARLAAMSPGCLR